MKLIDKIKAYFLKKKEIRRTVEKFKKHENFFFEKAVRDYLNGIITSEDVVLYINKRESAADQIRLWRKAEIDSAMRTAEAKLKGKVLTDKQINEARNELFVLKYNFDSIEKTNPLTASAIKSRLTRLSNLQENIDYINNVITALENARKGPKKTTELYPSEETDAEDKKPKRKKHKAKKVAGVTPKIKEEEQENEKQ